MRIILASDHAGFSLKEKIKAWLQQKGYVVHDVGAFSEERSDYPGFAHQAAEKLAKGEADRGVLVCGSGMGMCMAANRTPGVRAAVLRNEEDARLSRAHNDANVACLGGRLTDPEEGTKLLEIFLNTPFEGGRHIPRLQKLEKKNDCF